MDSELLDKINERAGRGEPFAVVRILGGDNQLVSVYDGELHPPIPDKELGAKVLSSVRGLTVKARIADLVDVMDEKGSVVTLALEIIRPEPELLVFGGGHVGQAVALIGALTGYRVTDPTSGFFAINRRLIEFYSRHYPSDYPEVDAYILMHRLKARTVEVPVRMYDRAEGKSSITAFRAVYYMVKVTLSYLINCIRRVG